MKEDEEENEIEDTTEFDLLEEDEGGGSYCCGKRMVERGNFKHKNTVGWEYSPS
jgi:hypothetical protein